MPKNSRGSRMTIGATLAVGAALSIAALTVWLGSNPAEGLVAEYPGMDGLFGGAGAAGPEVDLSGVFLTFDGTPSDLPGEWTTFRGADFDNISKSSVPLADSWGGDGPEVVWTIDVGEGYAAPVVYDGVVYLMDYDQEENADALRAFSLDDGKEIWRRSYKLKIKRNHGMSRTIPAVTDKYLVTMGPKCHVVCLDTATGDFRWGIDLQANYGTDEPLWYTGQCPVIVDDEVIIAPAGDDVLMMSVSCDTGEVLWETPNRFGWDMSHASIIPMTFLGKKMYIYFALGGITAVSAEGNDVGEVLWEFPWISTVVAPSPVQVDDELMFVTVGYGKGHKMLRVSEDGGEYSVAIVDEKLPAEGLACEQQTPIYHDGLLYGVMPKDAGALKGQFMCYRPDGTIAWTSGQDKRFGLGPFLLADDKFYIMDDHGALTMLDATKSKYVELGHAEVLHGHDAWGPIALAGSRMLLRDMNKMACVDVGAK